MAHQPSDCDFNWKIAFERLVSKVMDQLDLLEESVLNGEISSNAVHKIIKKLIQDEQNRTSAAQSQTSWSAQKKEAPNFKRVTVNKEEKKTNLKEKENLNLDLNQTVDIDIDIDIDIEVTNTENPNVENMNLDIDKIENGDGAKSSPLFQTEQADAKKNLNVQQTDHQTDTISENSLDQNPNGGEENHQNEERHLKPPLNKKPFKCPKCPYRAKSKMNVRAHLKNIHQLSRPFQCSHPGCNYTTKQKGNLKIHMTIHSGENPFACSFESCDYKTKFKGNLSVHLKTHSEERRYKCELCPYRAKTRGTVSIHLKQVHSDPKSWTFKCKEAKCDFVSKTNTKLQRHLLTHSKEKKYACSFPDCEFLARAKQNVKQHEFYFHSEEKKEKCPLCDFKCKAKSTLRIHMRTHTKEEPYKCNEPNCVYRAKQAGALKAHQKKHHPEI